MNKKQLKLLAKMYSAVLVYHSLGTGASSDEFTLDDEEYFANEVEKIAVKMVQSLPGNEEVFRIGSLDGLIDYIKQVTHKDN